MFRRILLAVDGSESDDVSTSFVSALARESSAAVRVAYVNEYLVGGRGFTRSTTAEAREIVDGAARSLVVCGVAADGEVRLATTFDMASRIADAAAEWSADVIVVGSRRHRRLGRLSGRGMREKVTALTALPILTVPAPLRLGRARQLEAFELPPTVPEEANTPGRSNTDPLGSRAARPSRSAHRGRAR